MKARKFSGKPAAFSRVVAPATSAKRVVFPQADAPELAISETLALPRAIVNSYAGVSATPLQLAMALDMRPGSDAFRALCASSAAYGLTVGSYNAKEIALTPQGKRAVHPFAEEDDRIMLREAAFKPRVLGAFVDRYANSALPSREVAIQVLAAMEVPRSRAAAVYEVILENAEFLGVLSAIKGKQFLDLASVPKVCPTTMSRGPDASESAPVACLPVESLPQSMAVGALSTSRAMNRRVAVLHGSNKAFVDPIKRLLVILEMVPVVSTERQSVSKPVPDKVMDDMRSCGAAIIHVDEEATLFDDDRVEHTVINPNVLIEIGAAMLAYGRRFILLVKDGIKLPSNLQGLYEVRYRGDALSDDATIRLLEAMGDIKNHSLPRWFDAA
jgi:predicted nucleotide-binding protein